MEKMFSKNDMRSGVLVALVLFQLVASINSAPLDMLKGAAKSVAEKAADVADKTEPGKCTARYFKF